jgi:hypothetical protein
MKGDFRRLVHERLSELILGEEMRAKVAAVRALHPGVLPDIAAVYVNEEDANRVVSTPCVLLFPQGPSVNQPMTLAFHYEFPIDICMFDHVGSDGLPPLRNRLYAYQGCFTDLLLTDYSYEAGYWDSAYPMGPIEPDALVHQLFGALGRVEGYRFGFAKSIGYS